MLKILEADKKILTYCKKNLQKCKNTFYIIICPSHKTNNDLILHHASELRVDCNSLLVMKYNNWM